MPSLAPPLASLSQRNSNGTLKLSFQASPATSSQARKQEMTARTPPTMAIGEGPTVRLRGTPRELDKPVDLAHGGAGSPKMVMHWLGRAEQTAVAGET